MNQSGGAVVWVFDADTGKFNRALMEAKSNIKSIGDETDTANEKQSSWAVAGGRALTALKVAGVAAGAATVAMGAAAFKTGLDYNALRQSTVAALTTIMGSAEDANKQMNKLDDFARTSPFARDVFIRAQQQLLGFGVEARKVIPALDAVQNAVAAVGGSSQDISAVTEILAKLKSEGRLSGEALLQLGGYGIDAATIIGEQMGKSGQEIREMASRPGGIPVDQVWDPLINGLDQKFGGAADNVKNTWVGTLDRIMAAFRDVGSVLAAPFVDPNGGGAAIEWGNKLATWMREIQPVIKQAWNITINFLKDVATWIKPVTDFIAQNKQAWEVLGTALLVILVVVALVIVAIGVTLVAAVAAVMAIINAAVWLIEGFVGVIIYLGNAIAAVIWWFWSLGVTVFNAMANIAKSISDGINTAVNWFKSLPGRILGAIGDLGSLLYNVGKSIMEGLANGIKAAADVPKKAMEGALNKLKNLLPRSPAKEGPFSGKGWTLYSGQSIMDGLSEGIVSRSAQTGVAMESAMEVVAAPTKVSGDSLSNGKAAKTGNNITVNVNMSGIMTRSPADERSIAKSLIERVNEELRSRGEPQIGGGALSGGVANG